MSITFSSQARRHLGRHIERYVERLLAKAPDGKQTFGNASQNKMVLNVLQKSQQFGDQASHLRLVSHFAATLQHSVNLTVLDRHLRLALTQEMPNAEYIKLASLHIRLLTQRGELEGAQEVLERAWAAADTPLLQAELYNRRGILLEIKGIFPASYEAYIEGLALAEEYDNLYQVTLIYNNLGNWAFIQRRYQEALIYYQKALQVANSLNAAIDCARAEGGLAMTSGMLKQYEAANLYHHLAREHYEQANNRLGMIRVDLNRCYFALVQGKYDEAKKLANRARIEAYQLGDLQREAAALHNLGDIFLQTDDYEAACQHLAKALNIRQWLGMPIYKKATLDLIQQLVERIERDSQIEPALQEPLLRQCQSMLKGDTE